MRAPRASACASDSRTSRPAPSPSTKPSRPLSYGRLAAAGSSSRVDRAFIEANADIGSGWMQASAPPAMTMSARPRRIRSIAQLSASVPDAQALTGVCAPPRAPSLRLIVAAPPFGMSIWIVCGETRRAPFSRSTSYWP